MSLPADVSEDCYAEYAMVLTRPFSYDLVRERVSMPDGEQQAVLRYIKAKADTWLRDLIESGQITIDPTDTNGRYIGEKYAF